MGSANVALRVLETGTPSPVRSERSTVQATVDTTLPPAWKSLVSTETSSVRHVTPPSDSRARAASLAADLADVDPRAIEAARAASRAAVSTSARACAYLPPRTTSSKSNNKSGVKSTNSRVAEPTSRLRNVVLTEAFDGTGRRCMDGERKAGENVDCVSVDGHRRDVAIAVRGHNRRSDDRWSSRAEEGRC